MSSRLRLVCAGISATAVAAGRAAFAQEASPVFAPPTAAAPTAAGQLDEVVVTAQRRSENLQKVPIAVTSFSAAALNTQQVVDTLDVARLVPSFIATNNTGLGAANVYYIRGLGQVQSFPTFEPQVGSYIDDIYIARQNANNFSLFGVDSLQVLRGPQGTLFGRNAVGGAVVVTLQRPSSQFGGSAEVDAGSYGMVRERASVDIPIGDQLRTRTSVYGEHSDGYVRDVTTGERLNGSDNYGVREALDIRPAKYGNVEWYLTGDYEVTNEASQQNQPASGPAQQNFDSAGGSDRISFTGLSKYGQPFAPFLTGKKAQHGLQSDVQSWGFSSNLKVSFDAGVLNIITGFRGLNQKDTLDFPATAFGDMSYDAISPIGQFGLAQDYTGDQYSQEIKWNGLALNGRLNYTGGLYYLFETNRDNFGVAGNIVQLLPPAVQALAPILYPGYGGKYFPVALVDEFTKNQTISEAGYLQGDFKVTSALTLTVGGRFTHEIKTVTDRPNSVAYPGFSTSDVIAAGYLTKLSTNQFTPRFALQYQVNPDLMAFVSATRGFQGGGWNGLSTSAASFNNFGPETIWSYEGGFRSETPNHKLRLNTTLFYEEVTDYQLLSDLSNNAGFSTENASNLRGYGLETEITWQPIKNLSVNGNFGLFHAEYYDQSPAVRLQQMQCVTTGAGCATGIVNAQGRLATPIYSPPFKSSLSASYVFDFQRFTVTPIAAVQYSARYNTGTEGAVAGIDHPYTTIDFGTTLHLNGAPWKLTAECRNCTMVDYGTTYVLGYRFYNNPGTWDVKLTYEF